MKKSTCVGMERGPQEVSLCSRKREEGRSRFFDAIFLSGKEEEEEDRGSKEGVKVLEIHREGRADFPGRYEACCGAKTGKVVKG